MDRIAEILGEMKNYRSRLNAAIAALEGIDTDNSKSTTPPSTDGRRRRRTMSPAARRRISKAMKARWAERKRNER